MTGQIKFSVVISAYNVEEYLPGLLQDLLEQTYNNFEVILVDDCATDQTGAVAESYLQAFRGKQADYVVIHKPENEGLSMARNTGISHAAGDYILFLDADDGVERPFGKALSCFGRAAGGYGRLWLHRGLLSKKMPCPIRCRRRRNYIIFQIISMMAHRGGKRPLAYAYPYIIELEHETMFGYAWNKAYRLSFLQEHKLQFQNIVHIEDILFNVQAAGALQSLLTLPDVLYHYANRGQSRLTDKYLPEYFALQKTRVQAFLNMQMRKIQTVTEGMTKGETGGWKTWTLEHGACACMKSWLGYISGLSSHPWSEAYSTATASARSWQGQGLNWKVLCMADCAATYRRMGAWQRSSMPHWCEEISAEPIAEPRRSPGRKKTYGGSLCKVKQNR